MFQVFSISPENDEPVANPEGVAEGAGIGGEDALVEEGRGLCESKAGVAEPVGMKRTWGINHHSCSRGAKPVRPTWNRPKLSKRRDHAAIRR